jgi:hypothetical protein
VNTNLTVALTLPAVLAATLVTITPLKALLEVFVLPTNRAHDALVQMLALIVGLIWAAIFVWASGPVTRSAAVAVIISVLLGLSGGSAAIGVQRVVTTSTRRPPAPEPPPSAPVVPPVPSPDVSSEVPIRPQEP